MNFFRCALIIMLMNGFVLYADESEKIGLQNALSKIEIGIADSKDALDGAKKQYAEAKISKDESKIAEAKVALDNATSSYNALSSEYDRINNDLNSDKSSNLGSISKSNVVSTISKISTQKKLVVGWNVFSIPINFTMLSSNKYLGNYSVIWGFNGTTQTWLKNPKILYPGEGYYVKIVRGESIVKFGGNMFTTDLGSLVVKDKSWYFLGASEAVENIDYSKYKILKYVNGAFVKNPDKIKTGDTFWGYRY